MAERRRNTNEFVCFHIVAKQKRLRYRGDFPSEFCSCVSKLTAFHTAEKEHKKRVHVAKYEYLSIFKRLLLFLCSRFEGMARSDIRLLLRFRVNESYEVGVIAMKIIHAFHKSPKPFCQRDSVRRKRFREGSNLSSKLPAPGRPMTTTNNFQLVETTLDGRHFCWFLLIWFQENPDLNRTLAAAKKVCCHPLFVLFEIERDYQTGDVSIWLQHKFSKLYQRTSENVDSAKPVVGNLFLARARKCWYLRWVDINRIWHLV